MAHCWRFLYWIIVEKPLVCHPKVREVYIKKVATEKHRFAASKEA